MRRMYKFSSCLCVCIVALFVSCNNNEYSKYVDPHLEPYSATNHTDCFDDFDDYDGCSEINTFTVSPYYHDDYPDCYFSVEIDYVQCATPGFFHIVAGNYRLVNHYQNGSSTVGCNAYMDGLESATANGDAALLDFVVQFDKVVMYDLGNTLASLDATAPLPCGNNNKVAFTWTRAACFATCVTEYSDGLSTHQRIPCDGSGCCLTSSEICYNLLTNEYEISNTQTESPGNGDCKGLTLLESGGLEGLPRPGDNTIPRNCTYVTPCQYECE